MEDSEATILDVSDGEIGRRGAVPSVNAASVCGLGT
jgi:hypothetical protein